MGLQLQGQGQGQALSSFSRHKRRKARRLDTYQEQGSVKWPSCPASRQTHRGMRELRPRGQWLPLLTVAFLLGAANLVMLRWTMFSSNDKTLADQQLSLPMNMNGTSADLTREGVVDGVWPGAGVTSSDTPRKMKNENRHNSRGDKDTQETPSCFRARESNTSISLLDSLPLINLGFPKMGTSSIHSFFGCAGLRSVHYRCNKDQSCAECVKESVSAGDPPLEKCGRSDVYSQLDGKSDPLRSAFSHEYFPQIEHLESLVRDYQNATFLLTFRSMSKWYHSITNWPPVKTPTKLDFRLRFSNIKNFPSGRGRNQTEFEEWFCDHVKRVREVVPPERLVEIDIESKSTGSRLGDIFDLDPNCWSQANVNFNVHNSSELANSTAKGSVPWLIKRNIEIKGRDGPRPRYPSLPPFPNALIPHKITSELGSGIEQGNKWPVPEKMDWTGTCSALKAHQDGHWKHTSNLTGSVDFAHSVFQYYPKEVSWLLREGVQPDFGFCMPPRQYLSYTTSVGHQCGCKHSDFAPTHSKWTHRGMAAVADPILLEGRPNYAEMSPTVRLAKSLAKAQGTICLAGDSIDYQIYVALGNNLKRAAQLFKEYVKTGEVLMSVLQREIKVSYSTKPGNWDSFWKNGQRPPDGDGSFLNAMRPPPNGFGSMYSILETKAFFEDAGRARFRYYMSYGENSERATHNLAFPNPNLLDRLVAVDS